MKRSQQDKDTMRDEWRKLGFFYQCDQRQRMWRLVGSKSGLMSVKDLLTAYVADPRHEQLAQLERYGPYGYFEVMTGEKPGIDENGVYGRLSDLHRLGELVEERLSQALPGATFSIKREYAEDAKYSIVFQVVDDDFDPSSEDPRLFTPIV